MHKKIKGIISKVWLNEETQNMPARLSLDGVYYSTFDKELLDNINEGDHVLIKYHLEQGKYNTIDEIIKMSNDNPTKTETNIMLSGAEERLKKSITMLSEVLDYVQQKRRL